MCLALGALASAAPSLTSCWVRVQVHVRDVHVRFEDFSSCPTKPFVVGVTLESIHAQVETTSGASTLSW